MFQARSQQTIVGVPLTPELLMKIGGLSEFPPAPEGFRPDGNWVNTYRIYACHGYIESGNEDAGVLRLERVAGASRESFTLKVQQKVVDSEGRSNFVEAEVQCRNDKLGSPVEWRLSSRFADLDGSPIAGLDCEEEGRAGSSGVAITMGGHTLQHKASSDVTADWCLFEAVQRLAFKQGTSPVFDLLEGMRLLREQHRLSYRGLYPWKGKPASLHWFHQIGHGVLPYEYWLDEKHRLLAASMLARAYVIDDNAEAAFQRRLEQIRQAKARRRNA